MENMKNTNQDLENLADEFISNSPDFYKDTSLGYIDKKHSEVISQAYKEFDVSRFRNFRSWQKQDDLGCPASFSLKRGWGRGILNPLLRKAFRRKKERILKQTYLDDLAMIRSIGAEELLRENPVDLTPGVTSFYKVDGLSANSRWLRYIYLAKRILDLRILDRDAVWIDIGSYYGGLQGLVKRYSPDCNIILVDFHHQLCRSYLYLKSLYPNSIHVFPNELGNLDSVLYSSIGSFFYVPVSDFSAVENLNATLATNFFSFGEMKREKFLEYFGSRVVSRSRYSYFVNRFISSPWFEPTYDSDLTIKDYLRGDRSLEYFDVFAMHHYQLINRPLFGREGFRNISSSYFELITKAPAS